MSKEKKPPENSPFAGCAIFIVAAAVILFLIIFSVVVLFRQFDAISQFTDTEPIEIESVEVEGKGSELNQLSTRVEKFRTALVDEESGVLVLSAADLNLGISAYGEFKDLRNTLSVQEISEKGIVCKIAFQLNGRPRLAKGDEGGMIGSDPRYLNADLVVKPVLLDGEIVLDILDVDVVNSFVPKAFIQQMSPYRITERYIGDNPLGRAMGQLTAIELGADEIRFISEVGVDPVHMITDTEVNFAGSRLAMILGTVASAFLLLVALILFIGIRASRKKQKAEEDA